MKAVIHVGMHKTGSTSIQQTLAKMPDLGERFFYPRLGERANHSVALNLMFSPKPEQHHLVKMQGISKAVAQKEGAALRESLLQQMAKAQGRAPVLSAEYLSSCPEDMLVRLNDFLRGAGYEPAVKAYVRPAADYIRSDFQQRVKGGSGTFDLGVCYPKYRMRFSRVERVFGAQNVEYFVFSPGQLKGGNVVLDFCERVGLPAPAPDLISRSNDSLSRTALALLFQYRRLALPLEPGPEAFKKFRRVLVAVRAIEGPKFSLAPALIQPELEARADDIAWMSERAGHFFGALPAPSPDDVQSESHLLALGQEAFEQVRERLGVGSAALDADGVEKVMAELVRSAASARRGPGAERRRAQVSKRPQ